MLAFLITGGIGIVLLLVVLLLVVLLLVVVIVGDVLGGALDSIGAGTGWVTGSRSR